MIRDDLQRAVTFVMTSEILDVIEFEPFARPRLDRLFETHDRLCFRLVRTVEPRRGDVAEDIVWMVSQETLGVHFALLSAMLDEFILPARLGLREHL